MCHTFTDFRQYMYKIYVHCTVLNSINFLAHDINFMNSVYPDRGQLPKHVDRLLAQKSLIVI